MCALRGQNSRYPHDEVPSYYVNNRIFPGSYTRNDYPTRTSRRIHDGLTIDRNYGLDTVADDVDSSPYSSPYYVNGRYNSDNVTTQRGNSASVQGTKRLLSIGDYSEDFTKEDIQTYIEMWQGKQIRFELDYKDRIVGNTITLRNTGGCTGILSMYFSTTPEGTPIYETAIDLCQISQDDFEHKEVFSNLTVGPKANPLEKIYVRMEIWDEVSQERSANPFNTGRKIEIAATGLGNHDECIYTLGPKNLPVKEDYTYNRMPSRPCMGLIYNSYTSIPVKRGDITPVGASVSKDGYRYDIFAYKDEHEAHILIYDKLMNKAIDNEIKLDGRTERVEVIQAEDKVYYVDGYSPLQKFTIGEWKSEDFPASTASEVSTTIDAAKFKTSPLGEEAGTYIFIYKDSKWTYDDEQVNLADYGITISGPIAPSGRIAVVYNTSEGGEPSETTATYTDGRPVVAASIIYFHNNRIYLSGFRYDPNLIQMSEITEAGPDFNSFPYRIYAPNLSPLSTSTNPITAILEYTSDGVLITGKNFKSNFSTDTARNGSNLEAGYLVQISTWTDSTGVASSGDICNYGGVVYSFDPDEGLRRYNGANWTKVGDVVKSLFDRVDMNEPRHMWGYARKLYFNFIDKLDGKRKCIVYDLDMNYQQYPFFLDVDMPFCDVRADDDFDLVGIHAEYPCVMQLYAEDTWRRFDTPITFERHTKYLSLPGNFSNMIIKRVETKVLSNANRWWWIGIAEDTDTLAQYRGKDKNTYRFPAWDTINEDGPVESPFTPDDSYEENSISMLMIRNLRINCMSAQIKIKTKTFRSQASLISVGLEAQVKQYQ